MTRLIASLMLAAVCTMAAADADSDAVLAAAKQWLAAIKGRDTATLEKLLGDQLIYAHATGVIDTKKDYIAKVGSGRQKYEGAEQEKVEIRRYGNTTIVHAHLHMSGVNQAGKFDDYVMAMHTWVKSGGRWQLVAHQTTKIK